MKAIISDDEHDEPKRIVTLLDDDNHTPEFDRAFYEASQQPASCLQELLERIGEAMEKPGAAPRGG